MLEAINLKVPNTGWNGINIKNKNNILKDILNVSDYYFNHIYVLSLKIKI